METLRLKEAIYTALGSIIIPPCVMNRIFGNNRLMNHAKEIDWKNFIQNKNNFQWRFLSLNSTKITWNGNGNINMPALREELLKEYVEEENRISGNNFFRLLKNYLSHDGMTDPEKLHREEKALILRLLKSSPDSPGCRRYLTIMLLSCDEYTSPWTEQLLEQRYPAALC